MINDRKRDGTQKANYSNWTKMKYAESEQIWRGKVERNLIVTCFVSLVIRQKLKYSIFNDYK